MLGTEPVETVNDNGRLAPHALLATTTIFPPETPATVPMLFDVLVPDQPDGKVHVYEVAPTAIAVLYTFVEPGQTVVAPLILPVRTGTAPMLIVNDCAAL